MKIKVGDKFSFNLYPCAYCRKSLSIVVNLLSSHRGLPTALVKKLCCGMSEEWTLEGIITYGKLIDSKPTSKLCKGWKKRD